MCIGLEHGRDDIPEDKIWHLCQELGIGHLKVLAFAFTRIVISNRRYQVDENLCVLRHLAMQNSASMARGSPAAIRYCLGYAGDCLSTIMETQ